LPGPLVVSIGGWGPTTMLRALITMANDCADRNLIGRHVQGKRDYARAVNVGRLRSTSSLDAGGIAQLTLTTATRHWVGLHRRW
jgi:hypothetical protein